MGTGIQPGGTAAHAFNTQLALLEIDVVHIGDLQLATGRWLDLFGDLHHLIVIEVEAGHRIVGLRLNRLLFDGNRCAFPVKLHHAIAFRILHVVAKHGGAIGLLGRLLQGLAQAVTMENIVPQDQADRVIADKLLTDKEGLSQPIWTGLYRILDTDAPLTAIAQNALIGGLIVWRADHQDFADPRQHQGGERVVDHRLVVDRQQLFVDAECCRMQTGTAATSQNDAFHYIYAPSGVSLDIL